MTTRHETYFDVIWRQFRKDKSALISAWLLPLLFLLAILAPVIASNYPFVFFEEDGTAIYPWFRALFHMPGVDFVFNMALLCFLPWIGFTIAWVLYTRRHGWTRQGQISSAIMVYLAMTLALSAIFYFDAFRPNNAYATRTFVEEQFRTKNKTYGIYPPIPFGQIEQDSHVHYEPPLYVKPADKWTKANDGFIHLLGTDNTGGDVFVKMLYSLRISLTIGFVAVSIYMAIGIVVGALAGYFGGTTDMLISRVIEIVMLFPAFFLILTLVGLIGPSLYIIMVVIGLTSWPGIARLIRAEVLKQRAIEYTKAARCLGASHARIIFRHILPNALTPAYVAAPFGVAGAIVTEAGLSLLGFGIQPPTPTWGSLLQNALNAYHNWWLIVFPSLAIFVTVTLFNLVGSGLRDAMDPRLRQ